MNSVNTELDVKYRALPSKTCKISGVGGAIVQNIWSRQLKFNFIKKNKNKKKIMKQSLEIGDWKKRGGLLYKYNC